MSVKYLALHRYTPDGLRNAMAEGFTNRQAMAAKTYEAEGAKLLEFFLIADGDWDAAVLAEFPDGTDEHDAAARMMFAFKSSGALADVRAYRLASPAGVDAASRRTEETYVAPKAS